MVKVQVCVSSSLTVAPVITAGVREDQGGKSTAVVLL